MIFCYRRVIFDMTLRLGHQNIKETMQKNKNINRIITHSEHKGRNDSSHRHSKFTCLWPIISLTDLQADEAVNNVINQFAFSVNLEICTQRYNIRITDTSNRACVPVN